MFSPFNSPTVNDWFQRLDAAWKRMPAEERTRQREEVQQHLEGLATAKVATGQSPEAAWNATLVQFGDPTDIGRKMYQEWKMTRTGFRAEIHAIAFGLALWVLNYGLVQLLYLWPLIILFTGHHYLQWYSTTVFRVSLDALSYGGVFLIFALLGRKYPYIALKAALFTFVLELLLGWIPVVMLVSRENHAHLLPTMVTRTLPSMPLRLAEILLLSYFASVTKRGWYRPTLNDFKLTLPKRRRIAG